MLIDIAITYTNVREKFTTMGIRLPSPKMTNTMNKIIFKRML